MPHASEEVVQVAETFAAVARTLAEDHDGLQSALHKIVGLAVDTLDACEFAGISLVESREITSPVATNDIPQTSRRDPVPARRGAVHRRHRGA